MVNLESAAEATEIAVGFYKSYYRALQRHLSATLDQEKLVVEVDVGPFFPKYARSPHSNFCEAGPLIDTVGEFTERTAPVMGKLLKLVSGKAAEE